MPNKTYTRGLTRQQKERDCRIFETEFWTGREKREGSFDDITRILTDMRIASARALIQSQQYAIKQAALRIVIRIPRKGKTRLIVPSEKEMEESLLQQILNG